MDSVDSAMVRPKRAKRTGVTGAKDVHAPGVSSNKYRRNRFAGFLKLLEKVQADRPAGAPIRILDLGGAKHYWKG